MLIYSQEGDLVFFTDVHGVIASFGIEYVPEERRRFYQFVQKKPKSSSSLHIGNKYGQQSGYTKFTCFFANGTVVTGSNAI